jgi:hypothetical protein
MAEREALDTRPLANLFAIWLGRRRTLSSPTFPFAREHRHPHHPNFVEYLKFNP